MGPVLAPLLMSSQGGLTRSRVALGQSPSTAMVPTRKVSLKVSQTFEDLVKAVIRVFLSHTFTDKLWLQLVMDLS